MDAIGAACAFDRVRRDADQQRDNIPILVLQDIAQFNDAPSKGAQTLRPERFTYDADLPNPESERNLKHAAQYDARDGRRSAAAAQGGTDEKARLFIDVRRPGRPAGR